MKAMYGRGTLRTAWAEGAGRRRGTGSGGGAGGSGGEDLHVITRIEEGEGKGDGGSWVAWGGRAITASYPNTTCRAGGS